MRSKPTQQAGAQAERPTFKVGDQVEWNSYGQPWSMVKSDWKTGEVIAVIEPNASPYRIAERLDDKLFNVRPLRSGGGKTRPHVSYLVAVETKTKHGGYPRKRRSVYWPRVSQIRAVEPAPAIERPVLPPEEWG